MITNSISQLFNPVQFLPLTAKGYNILITRSQPWQFMLQDKLCTLKPIFLITPFQSAYTVIIQCGSGKWSIEFGKQPSLTLYPAFKDTPEILCVPEEVKLAVFELLLSPFFQQFENIMGTSVELISSTLYPDSEDFLVACSIPFVLRIEEYEDEISFIVKIEKKSDVLMFLSKLEELPLAYNYDVLSIPIEVGIEVGYTQLSRSQLQELEKDDILIPNQYFIKESRVLLRFSGFLVDCKIDGGIATVMDVNNVESPEQQNSEEQYEGQEYQEAARPESERQRGQPISEIDVASLELPVVFELDRRIMTVRDLSSIAPGYTFPMSIDPQAPVTLRVNGKAIGVGRIVDLNGSLGVQVIQMVDTSR